MSNNLTQTFRFRVTFYTWWFCWSVLHFLVLTNTGFNWQSAVFDSLISNVVLAGTTLLVSLTLHYYLPDQNKYGYLLGLCSALTFLWLFTSRGILVLLVKEGSEYESFFSGSFLLRGAAGFLIISCMALISVLWYTLQNQQEAERRKNDADKLVKDAELNNLRQQLQPHFLFNSLNSINALVGTQPQKARTMILQLSEFLRGTLKKEQYEWITLEEELQHLDLYLEIEKVRFGHRLTTRITNNATDAKLPVMILQPLVENAIKFGLYDTIGEIEIGINANNSGGDLLLQVTNPFDSQTSSPHKGTGFGLSSVSRRLYLLFARKDLLETVAENNTFTTIIKIPQP